jgi:hypothetical protein
MSRRLKRLLLAEYGSFADRRIKNIDKGNTFIVDDRNPNEANSSGDFNYSVPFIFVRVLDDEKVELLLTHNVPVNDKVKTLIDGRGGSISTGRVENLTVIIPAKDAKFVRLLSRNIEAITQRGAPRYPVPSWKYSVPRIVKCLDRLAGVLDKLESEPKQGFEEALGE